MDDDEEEALFDTDDEPETTEQDGPKLMKKNKSLQTTAMTAPCEEAKVEKKSFLAINSIPTAILRRQFNWPSCEEQNWRHLSNFIIRDRQGNMIDACMKGGSWKATGTLLARPGSNIPSLLDVEISFTNYRYTILHFSQYLFIELPFFDKSSDHLCGIPYDVQYRFWQVQ